jgi:hypothetical protein
MEFTDHLGEFLAAPEAELRRETEIAPEPDYPPKQTESRLARSTAQVKPTLEDHLRHLWVPVVLLTIVGTLWVIGSNKYDDDFIARGLPKPRPVLQPIHWRNSFVESR